MHPLAKGIQASDFPSNCIFTPRTLDKSVTEAVYVGSKSQTILLRALRRSGAVRCGISLSPATFWSNVGNEGRSCSAIHVRCIFIVYDEDIQSHIQILLGSRYADFVAGTFRYA